MLNKIVELVKETKPIIFDREKRSNITNKGYADYVTQVDFEVQKFLSEKLAELYPDIQFMGEEGERKDIDMTKSVWILDPIDGTANLVHNFNQSAVSLGLVVNNEPILGVVYNPFSDEVFYAEKGKGAYLNGKEIHVTDSKTMKECIICAGTAPYYKDLARDTADTIYRVMCASEDIRRYGSAAIDLCNVASGRVDGFFERMLKPWDYAAGIAILTEAGGMATNYDLGSIAYDRPDNIIASNGLIHEEFRNIVVGK